jgi:hypothetical protein
MNDGGEASQIGQRYRHMARVSIGRPLTAASAFQGIGAL